MKILVATPAALGFTHWRYTQSLLCDLFLAPDRLLDLERYNVAIHLTGGASGLGKDRGIVASFALRNNFDKLFFIDADQSWQWPDFKKLVDSPKDVIAGMVPLKNHPIQLNFTTQPDIAHIFKPEKSVITPKGIDRWRRQNPGTDELRVSACGTGFMCIDVPVLKAMVEAKVVDPFAYPETGDMKKGKLVQCWDFFPSGPVENNYYGEDYGFAICAQRAGKEVWVDTSVEIPHHGQYEYRIDQGRDDADPAQATLPFAPEL